jgi:hypothetical protein
MNRLVWGVQHGLKVESGRKQDSAFGALVVWICKIDVVSSSGDYLSPTSCSDEGMLVWLVLSVRSG